MVQVTATGRPITLENLSFNGTPILSEPDYHISQLQAPQVTYLGPEASFSDLAARTLFPDALKYDPQASFGDVIRSLSADPDLVGVIPVRNEITGDVYDILTYLRREGGRYAVLGEAPLMINLVLASKGHRIDNISTVYSHPQPLKQAKSFIDKLAGIKTHEVESTARAAEVVKGMAGTVAAICSPQAAHQYKLNCLADGIEDKPEPKNGDPNLAKPNMTRFIVVQSLAGFTPNLDDLLEFEGSRSKVAGIVSPRREEDEGLVEVLSYLNSRGIKTSTKIPSANPDKEGGLDYFLELRGDPYQLYETLEPTNVFTDTLMEFKLLGAYPVSRVIYRAPTDLYE